MAVNCCSARWVSPKERKEDGVGLILQSQQVTAFSHHPSQICLGEKAKEEVNRVEIFSSANQEDRKPPVTIATLKASVLPMVSLSVQAQGETVTALASSSDGPAHKCACLHVPGF